MCQVKEEIVAAKVDVLGNGDVVKEVVEKCHAELEVAEAAKEKAKDAVCSVEKIYSTFLYLLLF